MNYLKNALIGSIFFVLSVGATGQPTSITGTIVDNTGAPVIDAHIYIEEQKWAVSDINGEFQITSLLPGSYLLEVSRIGFKTLSQTVDIEQGEIVSLTLKLQDEIYRDSPIVVTASRTEKQLQDVSVPVSVINETEIKSSGSLRLSDILEEQIGLNTVSDHGTGIQVQGFDPEYTLIMIDNQPVIGRSAGTLDLTRLAIGNIKQIEIVKGPSSALWGSDALAGVINIITDKGDKPFSMDFNGRYGSYDTFDGSTNITFKRNQLKGRFFFNGNGSNGYDLNTDTKAPTIPEYRNYTLSGGLDYRLNKNIELGVSGRYYQEDQSYIGDITQQNGSIFETSNNDYQSDYSITPSVKINFGQIYLTEANAYFSAFESENRSIFTSNGDIYFEDDFSQTLNKYEVKQSAFWSEKHTTVTGAGMNSENLTAEIYADVPNFNSYFVFAQHEWKLYDDLFLTSGFRFDAHSEYRSQLSPKFSALFKPSRTISLRASFGGGFKAPDFRQLFLNFTNPIAGYSVFGSSTISEGITRLENDGQITDLLIDPTSISEITAERSFAINAGFDLYPTNELTITLNAFRNNVDDLIETQRIALKTNGQSVFTYFNLNNVYTQGIEIETKYSPTFLRGFNASFGYQFLDAKREITREFDRVVDGEVVSLSEKEFIPLYNRSKHSFNLKLFQLIERYDIETSLRFNIRGKYWFFDFNENNRDDDNEYVLEANSFKELMEKTIVNYSLAKTFAYRYKLQIGINNLFDFRNETLLPSNPGRIFYTQLNIKLY